MGLTFNSGVQRPDYGLRKTRGEFMTRSLLAPAKINLCLHVLGKRPDGYHDLGMLMQRVSLHDRIDITLVPRPGVRVVCAGVDLAPGEENITARAARRLLALAGKAVGVEIVIDKRIPVAAGLGGGSSDAASVLLALEEMLQLGLDRRALMAEGAALGADIPFFLFQQTAWATGIGEVLEPVPDLPPAWYVLVNPGLAVSTAWVYRNLGLTTGADTTKLPRFPKTLEALVGLLYNDLERVTIPRFPVIAQIKERLVSLGATGALMSGSGPTVFGVFEAEEIARSAAAALAGESGWHVSVVQPIEAVSQS
jgi:4-diphosphocytidyl-2-C-methyl-D-erythritol kinase